MKPDPVRPVPPVRNPPAAGADGALARHLAPRALLVRQLVVDRRRQASGWAFESVAIDASTDRAGWDGPVETPPSARMLAELLDGGGLDQHAVPGRTLMMVRVDAALLATDFVELLDARRTVLRLAPDVQPTPAAAERLRQLRARGFRIALDDRAATGSAAPWLPQAAYVTVEAGRAQGLAPGAASALRRHGARLVATGIDTAAQFALAHRCGFDLFVGNHWAEPPAAATRTLSPAHRAVLRALCLAQRDAPAAEIDEALKSDAALPFRLLRYINSAGLRTRHELRTIGEAVSMLGYRRLTRWLGMVLVTADAQAAAPPALSRAALARARLMESLPYDAAAEYDSDERFLVGLFSLLDAMLQMPMAQVLEHLPLSGAMHDALLHRLGTLGALLRMVESCEQFTADGCLDFPIAADAIDTAAFNAAQLDALDWADRVDGGR